MELQSLLNHTASRIMESQKDVVIQTMADNVSKNLILIGKWGFDGSTGHSEYKQTFIDKGSDDSNMFVTSYVPLQLIVIQETDKNIIWKNPRPASTRYCRPIRFQFKKETRALSVEEERYIKQKIRALQPTVININEENYTVEHDLHLTMVDGKVCSALSETSSAKCYICEATPKQMNNIDDCLQKQVKEERYEFGLSPLHTWIRFFEYFIHLSYRLNIRKWQVRTEEEKVEFAVRKKYIQEQFREKLGLIVDKPRQGGSGTTNDGNTARKFFHNAELSAQITGLKQDLIERCGTILQALSSGYEINKDKFKVFSEETARKLVQEYPWYYLPASVHKILIHGSDIIDYAVLSIGELSEEAAEAKNKDKKFQIKQHS